MGGALTPEVYEAVHHLMVVVELAQELAVAAVHAQDEHDTCQVVAVASASDAGQAPHPQAHVLGQMLVLGHSIALLGPIAWVEIVDEGQLLVGSVQPGASQPGNELAGRPFHTHVLGASACTCHPHAAHRKAVGLHSGYPC